MRKKEILGAIRYSYGAIIELGLDDEWHVSRRLLINDEMTLVVYPHKRQFSYNIRLSKFTVEPPDHTLGEIGIEKMNRRELIVILAAIQAQIKKKIQFEQRKLRGDKSS